MTALHSAVVYGYDALVELLLRNSANPNLESNQGWAPLLLTGYPISKRLLIENGANIEATPGGYDYQNALHHAAAFGHIAVVDVLIAMSCEQDASDLYGADAMHGAWRFGQRAIVKRLLSSGDEFCPISGDFPSRGGRMPDHSIIATKFCMS